MPAPSGVIFMTSNGVGMGHLSRQLTVALSGSSSTDSVIFSLSGALPRIMRASESGELPEASGRRLRYEYCPSRESRWIPSRGWKRVVRESYRSYRWHPYLRDRLVALAVETQACAVVFDGVVPYEGLLQARALLPELAFVWMRRGMWRPDALTHRLAAAEDFDLVVQPGDFAAAADRGPLAERTDARSIPPVSLVDVLAPSTREGSRAALGLPRDRPVLLLAPGSGALGSVEETAARIHRVIAAQREGWVIAVTRQSIVQHDIGGASDSVVVLDDVYPLARHLAAFDAAVSAAGYNAVHELLGRAVPTLLVPSLSHITDDQSARADGVVARGAALRADGDDLEAAVTRLLDEGVQAELRGGCATLEEPCGGIAASRLVKQQLGSARPSPRSLVAPPPSRAWVDARTTVPATGPSALQFTEEITVADVRGAVPVEHVLPQASPEYVQSRRRSAAWLYRPAPATAAARRR
ncbi:MAG: hypothetical protein WA892_09885 [Ornithinimicrobium sp.]